MPKLGSHRWTFSKTAGLFSLIFNYLFSCSKNYSLDVTGWCLAELSTLQEELGRAIEQDWVGVLVQVCRDELQGAVLVGGESQLQRLAQVSRLLVQDDGSVELRPGSSFKIPRSVQLVGWSGQQRQRPELLRLALQYSSEERDSATPARTCSRQMRRALL